MSRIKDWLQSRKEARVSTDVNRETNTILSVLTLIVALIFLAAFLWLAFSGGRWLYRKIAKNDETSQTTPDKPQKGSIEREDEPNKQEETTQPAITPPQNAPVPTNTPPETESLPRSGPSE